MPTRQELQLLQALPLELKIMKTKQRVREWVQRFGVDGVYVSFSGGKDSTVLLDIARKIYPDIEAVFVDTGLEYPEIREFVKSKDNVSWIYPIKYDKEKKEWVRTNFKEVIKTCGYPVISKRVAGYVESSKRNPNCKRAQYLKGEIKNSLYGNGKYAYLIDAPFKISESCCNAMKKQPMKKFVKDTGKHPIIGTMASESISRTITWQKQGCNAFEKSDPTSQPLSFWTEQDILQYLKQFNIPYASIYGDIVENEHGKLMTTGVSRTGCMFCMFGVHLEKNPNRFQRMAVTHPQLYDYCINKLGCGKVLDYIGVNYQPLQGKEVNDC